MTFTSLLFHTLTKYAALLITVEQICFIHINQSHLDIFEHCSRSPRSLFNLQVTDHFCCSDSINYLQIAHISSRNTSSQYPPFQANKSHLPFGIYIQPLLTHTLHKAFSTHRWKAIIGHTLLRLSFIAWLFILYGMESTPRETLSHSSDEEPGEPCPDISGSESRDRNCSTRSSAEPGEDADPE